MTDKIAIIGAGFDGLGVAAGLRRHGIEFDQFDAREEVGGLWYDGVYDSIHTVTSKRTTEFPSFPMPDHYPDFPSGQQMREYFSRYADANELRRSLFLKTRVLRVSPSGVEWDLVLDSGETRKYAGVVIANGHYWDPKYPSYAEDFTGESLHSKDYRRPDAFRGKRVLVIGGGNSGTDIAFEAGQVADECCVSLRRTFWYLPKTFFGRPTVEMSNRWLPMFVRRGLVRTLLRVSVGDYSRYGLPAPDKQLFGKDVNLCVNTKLLDAIKHGRVHPKPAVEKVSGRMVSFSDGSTQEFDVICYATGYNFRLPFLSDDVVRFREGQPTDLIDGIFAPRHRNLYVVGMNITLYGHGPVLEPTADMLSAFIEAQRRTPHPVGEILAAMGRKPLDTYVSDPHRSVRTYRKLASLAASIPAYAKRHLDQL